MAFKGGLLILLLTGRRNAGNFLSGALIYEMV